MRKLSKLDTIFKILILINIVVSYLFLEKGDSGFTLILMLGMVLNYALVVNLWVLKPYCEKVLLISGIVNGWIIFSINLIKGYKLDNELFLTIYFVIVLLIFLLSYVTRRISAPQAIQILDEKFKSDINDTNDALLSLKKEYNFIIYILLFLIVGIIVFTSVVGIKGSSVLTMLILEILSVSVLAYIISINQIKKFLKTYAQNQKKVV